jgi:hypothetical protein
MNTNAIHYLALRASLNAALKDGTIRDQVEPGTYSNYVQATLSYSGVKVGDCKNQAGRIAWKPIAIAAIKRLNFDSVNALVREIQNGALTMPKKVTADEALELPKESLARKAFLLESLQPPTKRVLGSVYAPKSYTLEIETIKEAM